MKLRVALLLILSLPIIVLWLHVSLIVSTSVDGLIRVIIGMLLLVLIWLLNKYGSLDYVLSLILVLLVTSIMAQLGVGLLVESLTLVLPIFFVILLFRYQKSTILQVLMSTTIYVYVLLTSYAVSIGLSYKAALASFSVVTNIGRLVIAGKVPVTVFYEPVPGVIILYVLSIVALILLVVDIGRLREVGIHAIEEAIRIFFMAVFLSLCFVYGILLVTRVYFVMWSITATAIFIISYLAYRLLARDVS